jgi:taurine transport system permease protein
MRPVFEIIRPIPPVSWIPLTIVWLGIGLQAKAFIVFFAAFVPCLINSYTGIRQTSPVLINVAKTCGASNFTIFAQALASLRDDLTFAGLRVALGQRLGHPGRRGDAGFVQRLGLHDPDGSPVRPADIIILGIVVIGLIGTLFVAALGLIEERRILGWRRH